MSIADFLYQAGFWQWMGAIVLSGVIARGIGQFRLWGNTTKAKTVHKEAKP